MPKKASISFQPRKMSEFGMEKAPAMDSAFYYGYLLPMNERDKATLNLIANIFGNIAAIAVGIGLFERNPAGLIVALVFGFMAISTIRGIQ